MKKLSLSPNEIISYLDDEARALVLRKVSWRARHAYAGVEHGTERWVGNTIEADLFPTTDQQWRGVELELEQLKAEVKRLEARITHKP